MSIAQGEGSIISTVQDFLRWNQALYKERLIFSDPLHDIFMTETIYESIDGFDMDMEEVVKILNVAILQQRQAKLKPGVQRSLILWLGLLRGCIP